MTQKHSRIQAKKMSGLFLSKEQIYLHKKWLERPDKRILIA